MRACLRMAVGAEQKVGEIHMRHRLVRMMQDRLAIDAAGRIDGALSCEQRAELVERGEMGWVPLQDGDEGFSCLHTSIERAEQACAFDFGQKARFASARVRQFSIELAQPRLLCQARGPATWLTSVLFGRSHGLQAIRLSASQD